MNLPLTWQQVKEQRRTQRILERRAKRNPPPAQLSFYGVQDGAPDDQLHPENGPDAWHSLGLALGPTIKHIELFCEDIVKLSEHPSYQLSKWNSGTRKSRLARQVSFTTGFRKALKKHEQIHAQAYVAQAQRISELWDILYRERIRQWGLMRIVRRADGKEVVRCGPFRIGKNQKIEIIHFEMDIKRATVLIWTAYSLTELYEKVVKSSGIRPKWDLLCDRLPGDSGGKALAVLAKLLERVGRGQIVLHTRSSNDHGPDRPIEHLADCIATWAKDYHDHPGKPTSLVLDQIMADPDLTRRFNISVAWNDPKEKPAAESASAAGGKVT